MRNVNEAPYPEELAELVRQLRYKPGWEFQLVDTDRGQECRGLTFTALVRGPNGYHPDDAKKNVSVIHYFPVPAAAFNRRSWIHWLFKRISDVERHETMEFFRFVQPVEGSKRVRLEERPYRPSHADGNDPWMLVTLGTEQDALAPNTGRWLRLPLCRDCGHHHHGRMAEGFEVRELDCPDCGCGGPFDLGGVAFP